MKFLEPNKSVFGLDFFGRWFDGVRRQEWHVFVLPLDFSMLMKGLWHGITGSKTNRDVHLFVEKHCGIARVAITLAASWC